MNHKSAVFSALGDTSERKAVVFTSRDTRQVEVVVFTLGDSYQMGLVVFTLVDTHDMKAVVFTLGDTHETKAVVCTTGDTHEMKAVVFTLETHVRRVVWCFLGGWVGVGGGRGGTQEGIEVFTLGNTRQVWVALHAGWTHTPLLLACGLWSTVTTAGCARCSACGNRVLSTALYSL